MGLLRTILILLIIILILNFFRKYIRPIVKTASDINEREKKRNQTVDYRESSKPAKKKRPGDDDGEYIEFREIE